MKLKTAVFSIAVVTAGVAHAQSSADSVRNQLTEMGYADISIARSGDTYTVEAYRDGQKRELNYNGQTGEILSDRMYSESRSDRNDRSPTGKRSSDESSARSSSDTRSSDESSDRSSSDSRSTDESNDRSSSDSRSNDESNDRSSSDSRSNDESKDD